MSSKSVIGIATCAANTAASARIDLPTNADELEIAVNEVASGTGAWVRLGNQDVTAVVGTASTAATGSLTLTGQASDGQTVTIGERTYTWKTALTVPAVTFEVLIGANAAASVANLVAAIGAGAGAGTVYGTGTPAHHQVTAIDDTGDVVTVTAKTPGTAGNAIATTDTSSNMSWGAATLASGADGSETSFFVPVRTLRRVKKGSATHIAAIGVGANAVVNVTGLG